MKILVADDDITYRTILKAVLKKWNFEYTIVEDGDQAWSVLQEKDAPQLLLLDWEMPNLTGLDLCKRIRNSETTSQAYIILLSSRLSTNDTVTALNAGANDYIYKPFENLELQARLRVGERMVQLQNQLESVRQQLHIQATQDSLTNLYNRRAILEALNTKIQEAKREQTTFCLCMCDIDYFKSVNDTYGHPVGDLVIKNVAKTIKNTLRPYDKVGRFGGEEFLLVLYAPKEASYELIERIRKTVNNLQLRINGKLISISISMGYSCFTDKYETPEKFIAVADKALYKAKHAGRNCTKFIP